MFTRAKTECGCAYLAILHHVGGAHESYLHTFKGVSAREQQTAKMAEGPDPRANREFIISSAFEMRKKKVSCHLVSLLYTVYGTRYYFSTNSSSHAHFERALKCAGFGRKLVFAGSEVGNESSRACNN